MNHSCTRWRAGTLAFALAMAALPAGGAVGAEGPPAPPGIEVVASGLNAPFGLQMTPWGAFYLAEAVPGQITQVEPWNGDVNVAVPGINGAIGIAVDSRGGSWIITSGPDETGELAPGPYPPASLLHVDRWTGEVEVKADLMDYELAHNPDGQIQFGPDGLPLDALSNPFHVVTRPGGVLVADGGANAVLSINRDGTVSTLFVPPTVTTGACAERPNNTPDGIGCDAVPTGLAWGPDGSLYVSTLNGEAPGEGVVYQINPYSGEILEALGSFTSPLGVAVGDDGSVYVSEGLHGMPEGEGPPPDDFDPSSIGRLVRVAPDGARSYAALTTPTGLLYDDGELYATAYTLLGLFFGVPDVGQVVKVHPEAFAPAAASS